MVGKIAVISSALLVAGFMGATANAASLWSISEETPPAICDPGDLLESVECTGSYCDNLKISCQRRFALQSRQAYWTQWFSEEQGLGRCPDGFAVAGLTCHGDYCDDISLYCVDVPGLSNRNCTFTRSISEEGENRVNVLNNPNFDKAGQVFVATGLRCEGDYCDNISLAVCEY